MIQRKRTSFKINSRHSYDINKENLDNLKPQVEELQKLMTEIGSELYTPMTIKILQQCLMMIIHRN